MTRESEAQRTAHPNHRLRAARQRLGLSYREVADAIDLPDSHTVGRWERGENIPRLHYQRKLSELYGKSLEELGLFPQEPEQVKVTTPVLASAEQATTQPVSTDTFNLQPSFTSFLGRATEIAGVSALLKQPDIRLVTILGPGGVGKTRLALEVAKANQAQFAHNICLVSLAALTESQLVLPAIAAELRLSEQSTGTLAERLRHFFQQKPAFLLILDNFEQLLAASSSIEQLLAGSPGLKVLVTSRAVLHLAGEYDFDLAPLPLPAPGTRVEDLLASPAIQLFVQRAQARLHTFQVTPERLALIGKICAALDGLPLAIELVAAHVKLFPLPALLQEISNNHLRIFKNEVHATPERQQTLPKTITWSYNLLNEQEQWLFRHLTIFPGGITLHAAQALAKHTPFQPFDTLDTLFALVDQNMLRPTDQDQDEPFFLMLETLRAYGMDLLRQGDELLAARQAQAAYYLALLQEAGNFLTGPQQGLWLTRLDREKANLEATLAWLIENRESTQALAFCEVFGKFCGLRGYWSEEMHWLKAVLALAQTVPPTILHGRILRRAGHLAYRLRDLPTAHRLFEESINISTTLGDQMNLAGALSGLAWVLYREQQLADVPHLLTQSVAAARGSGNTWSLANALESHSRFLLFQGQPDTAWSLMQESLALARTIADNESLARLLNMAVTIKMALRGLDEASQLAAESFTSATAVGNKPLIALALNGLADVAAARENHTRAAELYQQRRTLAQELDDQPAVALANLKLSKIALQRKELETASLLARESLAFFQSHGDLPNITEASNLIEEITRNLGKG